MEKLESEKYFFFFRKKKMDELLYQQEERYEELIDVSSLPPLLSGVAHSLFPNIGEEEKLSSSPGKLNDFFRNKKFNKYPPSRKIFEEMDFDYEIRPSYVDDDGQTKRDFYNQISKNFMTLISNKIDLVFLMETTTLDLKVESYLYIYKKCDFPISINSYVEKIKMFRPFLFEGCGILNIDGSDTDKNISALTEMDHYTIDFYEKDILSINYAAYGNVVVTNHFSFDFEKFKLKSSCNLNHCTLEGYERNLSDRKCIREMSCFYTELRLRNGVIYDTLYGTSLILSKYRYDSPIHSFKIVYYFGKYYLVVKEYGILHPIAFEVRKKISSKFSFLVELINISEKSKVMEEYSSFITKILFENTLHRYDEAKK